MKKKIYLVIILFAAFAGAFGQTKSATISATYDRSSLTLILLNHQDVANSSKLTGGIGNVLIPDKYFDNKIDLKSVKAPFAANYLGVVTNSIKDVLNQQKAGNKIISYWYARQADGTMSADRFLERGMYNATDADVLKAKGTKRGVDALKDYGDKLIGKSYVVAIDYSKFTAIDDATLRGWSSDVKIYMYKIIFNDTIQSKLYNDLWIYQEDSPEVKAKKKAAFDEMNFKVEYVSQAATSVTETELKSNTSKIIPPKTNDELFAILMQKGLDDCIYNIEKNVEDMKVKTALYQTNPLKAKIGKKEGLAVDHRYFVYEYVYNEKSNSTTAVRRSVIRAKKVIDNRNVATGSSAMSTFYQIAGGHLENGFTLQQSNDAGIGIYLGDELGVVGGFSARLEANVGRFTSVPSLYVFIGGGMQTRAYNDNNTILKLTSTSPDMTFLRYELGVGKGFRLINILELAPYGGFGFEEAKNKDWKDDTQFNGNLIKAMYVKYGANLSLNLRYNIQVVGGIGSYIFLNAEDSKEALKIGDAKVKYDYYFKERGGVAAFSTFVGIRFQF
ncbi:MAG: hypothetical protein WCS03_08930 [Bacteroidota bacterium]